MKLTINGEVKIISGSNDTLFLQTLIEQLGHQPRLVVIEFNGKIIRPENWPSQKLNNGDRIEIVTIVGGGS